MSAEGKEDGALRVQAEALGKPPASDVLLYTPGPWHVSPHANEKWTVVASVNKHNTAFVASTRTLHGGNMQWEPDEASAWANARLIAAAPDLKSAGEEARAALYGAREVLGSIGNIQHAIDLLNAAISKATGA